MKVEEEGIFIKNYGKKISKNLKVFYNKEMKLNRDISLLLINSYFSKPIDFCDPMAASGIREIRFLKKIPSKFKKMVIGDISISAIEDIKSNFKENGIIINKEIQIIYDNAINTINKNYYDFIEIDPFGSPVPFLDISMQKIKHKGIISVTSTDTAALCGTYPKTALRKYGLKVRKTYWYEEFGLRNLIAYCIRQAGKYNKVATPLISFSNKHFYKTFLKIEETKTKSYEAILNLKYINYDKINQDIELLDYQEKDSLGKTYTGPLCDKDFLLKILENINLIEENKKVKNLLNKLTEELNIVGHYNIHKLEKEYKIKQSLKYDYLIKILKNNGFEVSRVHNNRFGIKTNAKGNEIVKLILENKNKL